MNEATKEEAHAHDQEQVGQDGSKHRGLNDLNLIFLEGNDTDLCRISTVVLI